MYADISVLNYNFITAITNDLLAMDIRQALHHLGEITGEITTDEIPIRMYGTFCIGM
jgi:tRNA modification GTPase